MKDIKENLYYAELQIKQAIKSPDLDNEIYSELEVHEIKHLLISAQLMIKLVNGKLKSPHTITSGLLSHGDLNHD